MINVTGQWQDPEIFIFCYTSTLQKIKSHAETPVPKFRSDLSVRVKDIAEKQVPSKLKPIVCSGGQEMTQYPF